MSLIYEKKTIETSIIVEKECNKCYKRIKRDDYIEWQEFFHIKINSGYGSIFGDSIPYNLDLCQDCAYELFGKYVQREGEFDVGLSS